MPASPHPGPESATLPPIQVCSVLMEVEWYPQKSPSSVDPRSTSPEGSRAAVTTVLGVSGEDRRAGTVLRPRRGKPQPPSEGATGSLTSSPQSPLCL